MLVAPGRHTRRPGQAGLRRVCVAALIMLVVQYGLGIFLNLYVAVPAADAHAGFLPEIATAPVALTGHALRGLALVGTAVLLVARAAAHDRLLAVLATAGLTGIGGAFGTGEIFVKNGQATASLAMAILTGAALLCYIGMLALAAAAERRTAASERRTPASVPVRAPRPRAPMTPPTAWPATPSRPGPAREGWPTGQNWPPQEDWPIDDGWPAEEGWPDAPRAGSNGSWFARD